MRLYKTNQSRKLLWYCILIKIWIGLQARTGQECLCMCNRRDTLRVGSKSGWRWRIWSWRGPWWGPQHFSLRPQSWQRNRGRSRNRDPCWLQDLGENVHGHMRKLWSTVSTRENLHTTKTSIPVPIGISTTAGGANVHRTSFTPHTVLYRHRCL